MRKRFLLCALTAVLLLTSCRSDETVPAAETQQPETDAATETEERKADETEAWTGAEADPAEVRALIEETFAEMFPDGCDVLSEREKARVIYDWITQNIHYRSDSDIMAIMYHDRIAEAVWEGLSERHGNCYTYYAVSAALLSRAGFLVKKAWTVNPYEKFESEQYHYWNLVLMNGEWLHFDTTPNFDGTILNNFLLTEEEITAKHLMDWTYTVEELDLSILFDGEMS